MHLLLPKSAQDILADWAKRIPSGLAIAIGIAQADPEFASQLRGAQISAIVRFTPVAMTASCLNAVIILATFAYVGRLRPALLDLGFTVLRKGLVLLPELAARP